MVYRRYRGEPESSARSLLSGCVVGFFVGCVLGMLMAPQRGEVTRRKIVRRAGEARERAAEAVEDQIAGLRSRMEDSRVEDSQGNTMLRTIEKEEIDGDENTDR